jgi:nitrite reductase/ring-hydroxylating ferredoxin subunit
MAIQLDTTPYWSTSASFPQFPKLAQDVTADVAVVGGSKIAAYRDRAGKITRLSATCTHMGARSFGSVRSGPGIARATDRGSNQLAT